MYIDIATLSANYMQRYAFFCEFTSFLGYIYSFFYETITYMLFLMSILLGWESFKNLEDLKVMQFSVLVLSLGIYSRKYLWKLNLENINKRNLKRKIKVDFLVVEKTEEIFYRQITLSGSDKCSDLLSYFMKNYLNEVKDNNNFLYKFYIADMLIFNITENGTVEYCQSIDFELGNFPIKN